jgi:outer membrane immunogenic protein
MKTALLAAFIALTTSTAFAADVVYEAPAAPIVEAPILFTWSGPYIGIQGGAGWATLTDSFGASSVDHSLDGGLVGGFVGFQHQFPSNLVLGIEGDLDYNWNDKDVEIFGLSGEFGTELAGSVRARAGYAVDRSLFYVTGGWATTRGYSEASDGVDTFKAKETFNGWTVGAGIEHAFTDNLFGRAEYRYSDYGSKDTDFGKVEIDQHAVKVGLGVKF